MTQSAKRRAQSEKLSMSKLPIFLRYAPCATCPELVEGCSRQSDLAPGTRLSILNGLFNTNDSIYSSVICATQLSLILSQVQ